ncbi:MAG: AraC family transcriptional regulator ligand-binding domain-containing protein [Oceanococcaceae bacterium]
MKSHDISVPARYYLRLAELLAQDGVPTARLFAQANIGTRGIYEPDAMLKLAQVESLLNIVFDDYGARGDLALELGRILPASTHSVVGFGMLNSAHVESSLQFVARFFRLVMPTFAMHYARQGRGAIIRWRPVVGMSARCLSFHIEAIASAAYREIRELSSDLPRFHVDLSIAEVPHLSRYQEMRGAWWQFGHLDWPGIELTFDFDAATYPLEMADTNALRVAEERCKALYNAVATRGSFTEWVVMMLRDAGNGQPSLNDLADVMNISTRSLHRYLEKEGSSFRELAKKVQHQLACERLKDSRHSITEIAISLGFTESSNFSRFFAARQGMSPRAYRMALAAKQGR